MFKIILYLLHITPAGCFTPFKFFQLMGLHKNLSRENYKEMIIYQATEMALAHLHGGNITQLVKQLLRY